MTDTPPSQAEEDGKGRFLAFWTTLPGILTGVAALITAIVSLVALWSSSGDESTPATASNRNVTAMSSEPSLSTAPESAGGVFAQGELTMMTPDDADLEH